MVFWVPVRLNEKTVWDHPWPIFPPVSSRLAPSLPHSSARLLPRAVEPLLGCPGLPHLLLPSLHGVMFLQNLSSVCHSQERPPPRSDIQAQLQKAPVLVRVELGTVSPPPGTFLYSLTPARAPLDTPHLASLPRTAPSPFAIESSVTSPPLATGRRSSSPSRATSRLTGTSRYGGRDVPRHDWAGMGSAAPDYTATLVSSTDATQAPPGGDHGRDYLQPVCLHLASWPGHLCEGSGTCLGHKGSGAGRNWGSQIPGRWGWTGQWEWE